MDPQRRPEWNDPLLIQRGIAFRGEALPAAPEPFLVEPQALAGMARDAGALCRAAELATDAFVADPGVRAIFGYGSLQTRCILKDPGYRPSIPLGRLDSFLFPDGPRFMEFNTDGTAAWHYSSALTALWREDAGLAPLAEPLPERMLNSLVACFRRWDRRAVDVPRIAIVDWSEVGTRPEQEALAACFSSLGYPTTQEDPRALRLSEGRLVGSAGPVDLVYRRLVSQEAFARAEEIRPFLDAYLSDAACFVGGFRTDPAWSKVLFVLLSDPAYRGLFPPDLASALDRCVPETRPVARGAVRWQGRQWDMGALLREERPRLLLKPAQSYEGRGVLSGLQASPETWAEASAFALARGGFIVQELLTPRPSSAQGARAAYMQVGLFVLLGRLAGLLARSSPTPIITPEVMERFHPIGVDVPWSPAP